MSGESPPLEKGVLKNLRYDIPSGVVVFLVALRSAWASPSHPRHP